ncbi:unnamed protein product, partial [Tilletia laevis]
PVVAPVAAEGKKPTKRKSLFGAVLAGIGGKHENHSAAASTPAAAAAAGESTDVPPITTTTNSTGVTPNTSTDAPAVPAASEKRTSNGSGGGLAKRASILTQDLKTVLSQKSGSKEKDGSSKENGHKKSKSASSSSGAGTVGGLRSILTQPLNVSNPLPHKREGSSSSGAGNEKELPGVPPKTPAKDGGAEVEEEGDVVEGADGTTVRVHENPRFKGQPASKVNPVQWRK